jgi:preprotein translocase subunit SecE
VARNRKRAKERRARRPTNGTARRGTATARLDSPKPIEHASPDVELAEAELARGRQEFERDDRGEPDVANGGARVEDGAQPEVEDAAGPGVEDTAEPEVEDAAEPGVEDVAGPDVEGASVADVGDAEPGAAEELANVEFGEAPNVPGVFPETVRPETAEEDAEEDADDAERGEAEFGAEAEEAAEEAEAEEAALEEALPAARRETAPAERRIRTGNRLINFLQGSWRELQRVQWPDRRQVMQATGVVIGFVIVAGVFLGVADFLATKIMNYILTGHFK